MKMVPFDAAKLNNIDRVRSDLYSTIQDFAASGHNCVKLEGWTHKNAKTCASSLRSTIKRYRMYHIKACARGNDVFLIKVL